MVKGSGLTSWREHGWPVTRGSEGRAGRFASASARPVVRTSLGTFECRQGEYPVDKAMLLRDPRTVDRKEFERCYQSVMDEQSRSSGWRIGIMNWVRKGLSYLFR